MKSLSEVKRILHTNPEVAERQFRVLMEENKKLREVLERIAGNELVGSWAINIAKAALKKEGE